MQASHKGLPTFILHSSWSRSSVPFYPEIFLCAAARLTRQLKSAQFALRMPAFGGIEWMAKPTLITVLRHGEVEGTPHVFRGKSDPVLSTNGWQQMQQALRTFPEFDAVATSPLARCRAFAESLAPKSGSVILDGFREMEFGDWEEQTPQAAQALSPELFERFQNNPEGLSPPNGEPFDVFRKRVNTTFKKWLDKADGGHRLLITHAGVMRILLVEHLGLPVCNLYRIALPHAASFQLSMLADHPPCLLNLNNGM